MLVPNLSFMVSSVSRLLIISDTHDNLAAIDDLIKCLKIGGYTYDSVIHLGDIVSPFTLRKLINELEAPMTAIFGNNDGDKPLLKSILPGIADPPVTVEWRGRRALLLHGFKSPEMTEFFVNSLASGRAYDIILYGHTHLARVTRINNTLVINPGTVSGYVSGKRTFAILDTEKLDAEIVDIDRCLTKEL